RENSEEVSRENSLEKSIVVETDFSTQDNYSNLLCPADRSPNINISRTLNCSPTPSSPRRTPVTENDPLGAFHPLHTNSSETNTLSNNVATDINTKLDPLASDADIAAELAAVSEPPRRTSRHRVSRSATFTSTSPLIEEGDLQRPRVKRSSNSLWAIPPSQSPTHHQQHTATSSTSSSQDLPALYSSDGTLATANPSSWSFPRVPTFSSSSGRLNQASSMASEGLRTASKQWEHLRDELLPKHIEQIRAQYLDPAMVDLGHY
ncbi:unnamed protein product, partial [Meganyctiphanes norvegica]